MKVLRCIAIVLPLVMVAAGCGRRESSRVVAPPPASQEPQIVEAHWVFERAALDGAVQLAASSPLIRRAIAGVEHPRLTPVYGYAVRVEGKASGGSQIGATILPYVVDGDSTHAVFFSLLEQDGKQQAESGELILGREPTALETGFIPLRIGDRIGWIKEGNAYIAGAGGQPQLSSQKFRLNKFVGCLLGGAANACQTGAAIAQTVAPGVPYASAVGCAAGVAILGIGCAAGSM
jgi:hypothetical protein